MHGAYIVCEPVGVYIYCFGIHSYASRLFCEAVQLTSMAGSTSVEAAARSFFPVQVSRYDLLPTVNLAIHEGNTTPVYPILLITIIL